MPETTYARHISIIRYTSPNSVLASYHEKKNKNATGTSVKVA